MSYLFELMWIIIGIVEMFFKNSDILRVAACFAVAALFNIAGNIAYRKIGGKYERR